MDADTPCQFCQIVEGTASADVVYRDDAVVVFLDARPVFPGHLLVIPTRHIETIEDFPDELAVPLARVVRAAAIAMRTGLGAQGSFIAQNNRVSQSVPHLHVHVIPRSKGDGLRGFFWPRVPYEDDAHRGAVAASLATTIARPLAG